MNRDCWGWGSRDSPQAPEGGWPGLGCRGKGEIGGRADRLQGSCGGRGVCAGSSVFPLTAASGSGVGGRRAGAPVTHCVSAPTPTPGPGPDLDECRVRSLCQHACRNTEGSYQCLCPAGYRLLPSGKNCQGELWPSRVWAGQVGASWEGLAPSSRFSTISREGGAGRGAQSTPEAHGQAGSHTPSRNYKVARAGSESSPGGGSQLCCVSPGSSPHLSEPQSPGEMELTVLPAIAG